MRRLENNIRNIVLERDGYKCQKCGGFKTLDAHHIIPVGVGGRDDINNLVILCRSCHKRAHVAMGCCVGPRKHRPIGNLITSGHEFRPIIQKIPMDKIVISYNFPVRVNQNGQFVVPRTVRDALGLKVGDVVDVTFATDEKKDAHEETCA